MPVPAYIDTDVSPGGAGTSGDPYSSLSEWDGADAGDLTGLGEAYVYWVGATADAGHTLSTDWTNESTSDFIHLKGNNTSLKRDQTKAWISVDPDTASYGLRCDNAYFVLEGFQVAVGDTTTGTMDVIWTNADAQVVLNVMLYANVSTRISTSGTVYGFSATYKTNTYYVNCTAVRMPTGFWANAVSSGGNIHYNCLAYDCDYGFDGNTGKELMKNCIAQACTDGFLTCSNSNDTNNTSDIASDAPTTNGEQVSLTFSGAGYSNGDDYHLTAADATALGAGADLSADAAYAFAVDGESGSRSTWYRGPDEFVGGSSYSITASVSHTQTVGATMAYAAHRMLSGTVAGGDELVDADGVAVASELNIGYEYYAKTTNTTGNPDKTGTFSTDANGEWSIDLGDIGQSNGDWGTLILKKGTGVTALRAIIEKQIDGS